MRGIAEAIARLAAEPGLHERLAAGAFASVAHGHLSLERRRAALADVYAALSSRRFDLATRTRAGPAAGRRAARSPGLRAAAFVTGAARYAA